MSDIKPGSETSEFKITKIVMFGGLGLDTLGVLLEGLKTSGVNFGWLPAVLVVVGSLMTLVKALGYTRSRTMQKLAEAGPKVSQEVSHIIPLVKELAATVKELRAEVKAKPAEATLPTLPQP